MKKKINREATEKMITDLQSIIRETQDKRSDGVYIEPNIVDLLYRQVGAINADGTPTEEYGGTRTDVGHPFYSGVN